MNEYAHTGLVRGAGTKARKYCMCEDEASKEKEKRMGSRAGSLMGKNVRSMRSSGYLFFHYRYHVTKQSLTRLLGDLGLYPSTIVPDCLAQTPQWLELDKEKWSH